jgi:hypothetical protein
MTDATTVQPDPLLEAYVLRVGAALGDVEPTERHALLADLRLHLDEIAQHDSRRLDDIVGPPEVYAEELRAAAGLAAPATAVPPTPTPGSAVGPTGGPADRRHVPAWPWLRAHLVRALRAIARGGHDVASAARQARANEPTWWLVRAYLAVHVLGALTGSQGAVLLPHVLHERLWGLVALFACAVASVRVGRDPDLVPRRVVQIGDITVLVLGLLLLVQADMHHG